MNPYQILGITPSTSYEDAKRIEDAVEATLAAGILTRDIGGQASTKEMTEAIIERL